MAPNASKRDANLEFEREKWADEVRLREREIDARAIEATAKAREQENHADQVKFNQEEARRTKWTNPLVVAVLAAAVAGAGNAFVALINGQAQRRSEEAKLTGQIRTEQIKADQALILEAIKANSDPDKAAANLTFFVETALIADEQRRKELQTFLKRRKPGEGPALPSASPSPTERLERGCPRESLITALNSLITTADGEILVESCVFRRGSIFAYLYRVENRAKNRTARIQWNPGLLNGMVPPGGFATAYRESSSPPSLLDTEISVGTNATQKLQAVVPKTTDQGKL
jgi:hypothetical protein